MKDAEDKGNKFKLLALKAKKELTESRKTVSDNKMSAVFSLHVFCAGGETQC